jgi:hypothetical protein
MNLEFYFSEPCISHWNPRVKGGLNSIKYPYILLFICKFASNVSVLSNSSTDICTTFKWQARNSNSNQRQIVLGVFRLTVSLARFLFFLVIMWIGLPLGGQAQFHLPAVCQLSWQTWPANGLERGKQSKRRLSVTQEMSVLYTTTLL